MSWSKRESKLLFAAILVVAACAAIAGATPLVGAAVTIGVATLLFVLLARMSGLERRFDHASAESQATTELARILPLRAPLRPMTGWAITPELGAILVRSVLERRPKTIVELGSGVSSVVHGYALELVGGGGRVYSLDHDAAYADVTRRELAMHGLSSVVEVVDAPLVDHVIGGETYSWYSLANLPADLSIDMLLVDGPPHFSGRKARYPALPLLLSRLAPEALVVLDDASREDERAIVERWLRENGRRVEHVFHPTRKGVSTLVLSRSDESTTSRSRS